MYRGRSTENSRPGGALAPAYMNDVLDAGPLSAGLPRVSACFTGRRFAVAIDRSVRVPVRSRLRSGDLRCSGVGRMAPSAPHGQYAAIGSGCSPVETGFDGATESSPAIVVVAPSLERVGGRTRLRPRRMADRAAPRPVAGSRPAATSGFDQSGRLLGREIPWKGGRSNIFVRRPAHDCAASALRSRSLSREPRSAHRAGDRSCLPLGTRTPALTIDSVRSWPSGPEAQLPGGGEGGRSRTPAPASRDPTVRSPAQRRPRDDAPTSSRSWMLGVLHFPRARSRPRPTHIRAPRRQLRGAPPALDGWSRWREMARSPRERDRRGLAGQSSSRLQFRAQAQIARAPGQRPHDGRERAAPARGTRARASARRSSDDAARSAAAPPERPKGPVRSEGSQRREPTDARRILCRGSARRSRSAGWRCARMALLREGIGPCCPPL